MVNSHKVIYWGQPRARIVPILTKRRPLLIFCFLFRASDLNSDKSDKTSSLKGEEKEKKEKEKKKSPIIYLKWKKRQDKNSVGTDVESLFFLLFRRTNNYQIGSSLPLSFLRFVLIRLFPTTTIIIIIIIIVITKQLIK
uniref:Uncharacterized protein n=1 Tax=Caenorhabditis japonica TaxID=281687 RepID=A0A8R1IFH6_CAEJA